MNKKVALASIHNKRSFAKRRWFSLDRCVFSYICTAFSRKMILYLTKINYHSEKRPSKFNVFGRRPGASSVNQCILIEF